MEIRNAEDTIVTPDFGFCLSVLRGPRSELDAQEGDLNGLGAVCFFVSLFQS